MPNEWYRLDNAGKLYPALLDARRTTVFRLSADLTAPVHAGRLQEALDRLMPRFPYFAVNLRRGVFWYSLDSSGRPVKAERDSRYPCVHLPFKRRGILPFRVRAWRNRIAVEFSHVVTDGNGGLVFLKALLAEYLHLSGVPRRDDEGLPRPGEAPAPGEDEDAFRRYGDPSLPAIPRPEPAFRLPLALDDPGVYRVTTGIMRADDVARAAKERGATVTEFLAAVMLDAFREIVADMPPSLRRKAAAPLRINVPVNLRRFWPTPTMRNFFVSVDPGIDLRLGEYDFEEILDRARLHMRFEVDRKYLARRMARNVRSELNPVARLLPLALKDLVLPAAYAAFAERAYTSGLSNLGLVDFPPRLAPFVKRFDFIPPPAAGERVKAAVIGWKDAVHVSFGRLVRPAVAELYAFRKLVSMGIPVRIESN